VLPLPAIAATTIWSSRLRFIHVAIPSFFPPKALFALCEPSADAGIPLPELISATGTRNPEKHLPPPPPQRCRDVARDARERYLRSSLRNPFHGSPVPIIATLRNSRRPDWSPGWRVTLAERKEKTHRCRREIKRQISIMCARAPLGRVPRRITALLRPTDSSSISVRAPWLP